MFLAWIFPLLISIFPLSGFSEENSLTFSITNEWTRGFSQKELVKRVKPQTIKLFDIIYQKEKRYEGFPLKALLDSAFSTRWQDSSFSDAIFVATDGYQAVAPLALLDEDGGFVVFRDLDVPAWEPVSRAKVSPGPYYLVWKGDKQNTMNGYPWPYQLETIKLVKFEDQYPKILPKGVEKDSQAYRGFEIFKGQCFRCHSINQQGGKVGPDLNAPQSIIDYRPVKMVKEFIRNPSKYRYTHMPDNTHLTDQNLDELIAYFKNKSKDTDR